VSTTSSSGRRSVLLPLLIALVVLAALGVAVGWFVGTQLIDSRSAGSSGSGSGSGTGTVPTGVDETTSAGGLHCPTHTQDLAASAGASGELVEVLYIRTARAQVWICRDPAGTLFYQGSRAGVDNDMVEGRNALFLTDVVAKDGGYVATNRVDAKVTTYAVSDSELVQQTGTGDPDRSPVVAHRP
jgi:hypothetical protein